MDWRSGSKQNTTGSAFRGISSRTRGRGRGRNVPTNIRGGYTDTHFHAVAPAAALIPQPPPPRPSLPPPAAQTATPASSIHPSPSKPPPRTPSLSNLDTPTGSLGLPATPSPARGGRPHEGRRTPHNPLSVAISPMPSLKLDPSTSTIPSSPRPKPPRRRSHNRTRSSSKASTQQVSAAPTASSLRDNKKDAPPHLMSASASPIVQSFDLRTNIDTLVERVRAMAMAGSAIDREKDKEGIQTPHDGHIDWAGDEDDTLPDLDDWVKPKAIQHKENEEVELKVVSEQFSPLPGMETTDPGLTSQSQDMQRKSGSHGPKPQDNKQQALETKDIKKFKTSGNDVDFGSGRAKTRGKHGRKKSIALEASLLTSVAQTSVGPEAKPSESMGPTRPLLPLVHPLPPKPQISAPSVRGSRSRGPIHNVQPMARTKDPISSEMSSTPPSCEEAFVEPRSTHAVKPIVNTGGDGAVIEPQVRKMASDPAIDWANASRPTQNSNIESVREASEAPSSTVGAHLDTHTRKRAFDPSVDWSTTPETSLSRRSLSTVTYSSSHISPSPNLIHPHAAIRHDRSLNPFPHPNSSPRLSSAHISQKSSIHTRSQMNSPERSPRHRQNKEGMTHLRAHSSPQTGSGTHAHTSRPVITLDALSRISRTLGVSGATTPTRGPTVEVAVTD